MVGDPFPERIDATESEEASRDPEGDPCPEACDQMQRGDQAECRACPDPRRSLREHREVEGRQKPTCDHSGSSGIQ